MNNPYTVTRHPSISKEIFFHLLLGTRLETIYHSLNIENFGISISQFSSYLVFETLPADLSQLLLPAIEKLDLYSFEHIPTECNEDCLHERTFELLQLKYQGQWLNETQFSFIYQLPQESFKTFLTNVIETKNISPERAFDFYNFYQTVNEGK